MWVETGGGGWWMHALGLGGGGREVWIEAEVLRSVQLWWLKVGRGRAVQWWLVQAVRRCFLELSLERPANTSTGLNAACQAPVRSAKPTSTLLLRKSAALSPAVRTSF